MELRIEPNESTRLGAHLARDGSGVAFAVWAPEATRVEVCIFDPCAPTRELARLALPTRSGPIHHGYVPGLGLGACYGLRAHGPSEPGLGLRFAPEALLVDPYARALHGEVRFAEGESARVIELPRAVVLDDAFDWGADRAPATPFAHTLIAELHVKGATMLLADVPEPLRGSYAALGHSSFIARLVKLGVTAVELLPVFAFVDDAFLVARGLVNYWGYSPLSFFAPAPRYAHDKRLGGAVRELKGAIRALHAAGIEVLLDVVYNHTAEGGDHGPVLSLRGLDPRGYYRLSDAHASHLDHTGCGNTLDLSRIAAHRLVLESLRHWVEQYHVDGFRFDLASALGRERDRAFHGESAFFQAVLQDPVLSRVKLIAEPWDLGPDGYQVGAYPAPFAEWNDKFRDGARLFWRGEPDQEAALAQRLTGSPDLYAASQRGAVASINFVTCHDGSTLHDLVSYEQKHNLANGDHNRDGSSHEHGYHHGVEGETHDPGVNAARERTQRALLATLLLAQGVPMLLYGDERDRTQRGNNNAYCHDSPLSWVDYTDRPRAERLTRLVASLAELRRAHPHLYGGRFPHADFEPAAYDFAGAPLAEGSDRGLLAVLLAPDDAGAPALYVALNASPHDRVCTLSADVPAEHARLVFSSAPEGEPWPPLSGRTLRVPARTLVAVWVPGRA